MAPKTTSITILSSSEDEHEDIEPPKPARKRRCFEPNNPRETQQNDANNARKNQNDNSNNIGTNTSTTMTFPLLRPVNEDSQAYPPPVAFMSSSSISATSNSTIVSSANALPNKCVSKRKRDDTVPNVAPSIQRPAPQTACPSINQESSRNRLLWSIPPYEITPSTFTSQSSMANSQQRSKAVKNRSTHPQENHVSATNAPTSTWTKAQYVDLAITAERCFPFTAFATNINKPPSEVSEVFSALVQLPAILAARAPNVESAWNNTDIAEARMKDLRAKTAEAKKISEREMRDFLKKEIKEGVKEGVKKAKEREKVRKAKRKAKAAVARELEMSGSGSGIPRRKKAKGLLTSTISA